MFFQQRDLVSRT